MQETYELLKQGGPVMVPIALCSLIALTIFFERLWTLQRQRILPEQFIALLTRALREERWNRARSLCDGNESTIAQIARIGLSYRGHRRVVIKDAVQEAGRRAAAMLERFTGALAAIASISPLLGLLGTVTGMIAVFKSVVEQLSDGGEINAGVLAGGIWEALLTTAAGLTVAIPVFLAFRYLMSRIDQLVLELEECGSLIVDLVSEEGPMLETDPLHEDDPVKLPSKSSKGARKRKSKSRIDEAPPDPGAPVVAEGEPA